MKTYTFTKAEEKTIDDIMEEIKHRIKRGSLQGGLGAKDFTGVIYYMFKVEQ